MRDRTRVAIVGFVATAVTFGPGRMAYGLFLPKLREEFDFGTGTAGAIAGLAFAAFLLALVLTGWLIPRFGQRLPVVVGGGLAAAGLAATALAPGMLVMSVGVALAAASAGFAWTPFNTMVEQSVPEDHQKRVLSIVSTGTTVGIVFAGLLALGLALWEQTWRVAWGAFSATALGVIVAPLLLPKKSIDVDASQKPGLRSVLKRLACRRAVPLYGLAFSFGATNGTYLSYWIEHVSGSGGLEGVPGGWIGPLLFVAFGAAGSLGLLAGDVEERIGLKALLAVLFSASSASLLLLALLPGDWTGMLLSAALQGVCLMALSAVYSFWSERLFPDLASISFTAVLVVYATGNVIAPPLAGLMSGGFGLDLTLAVFGGVSLASLAFVPWAREV